MKPVFGDISVIETQHYLRNIEVGDSIEGFINHYGEYGKDIEFRCLICEKTKRIPLRWENSIMKCCGIIYNKKYRYGREIFIDGLDEDEIRKSLNQKMIK